MTPLLEVRDLVVRYGDIEVLHGVSFAVAERETVALIGANGAGKTTAMRAVAGLVRPAAGQVRFGGERIDGRPPHRLVEMGIVLIPEGRLLFPSLTVRENLLLGATAPHARPREAEALERVLALFPRLAERGAQAAGTLSGGEQQMLAIGRALMSAPRLLLVDEPSQGLAPLVVRQIFAALREVAASGVTVLLVEQNARQALALATRGVVLESGRVAREGPSEALLADEGIKRAYLGM
ncbi:MAG TPA: ABC transporter ATP-binding protein [Thermodesulfobacteriota bacterium]